MITEQDISKLKEHFVTKDEFKGEFDVLKKTFVTKDEFQAEIIPMKNDIAELKSDVKELKEDMKSVKETSQQILTIVDGFSKTFVDLKHEYVAASIKGDRHEKWIKHLADKTSNDLPEV